ncbi:MAG: NAD(P)/FAD-dependent oxidoreductase [Chitinophagaceae bacterium]|nr:MAG: NAD(P)/FAD-dependent oxidoreductase [Chitinophagaceae bacterium]
MMQTDYDAIVVGSGPNGLAAAIHLQQAGLSVLVLEAKDTPGGGMRTGELTLPGFHHDICSAVHPMAANSPFFRSLPLEKHGLEYIYPQIAAAHPFDDGSAAVLLHSLEQTGDSLGVDKDYYRQLMEPIVNDWPHIENDVLAPLHFPANPFKMAAFGIKAIQPATVLSRRFKDQKSKAFFAGMAAHSILPLNQLATSAIGLVLLASAHIKGWPVPRGGSQSLANALVSYFQSIGGTIQTGVTVKTLAQLPSSKAILFDCGPRQLMEIAGHKFSGLYTNQLKRYRYGMGVFKVDWALNAPIPFTNGQCRLAGTLHLGGSFNEIVASEQQTWLGSEPENPFVLLAQQSIIDDSRAPAGKHTAWAYCHVPNGSLKDMSNIIEQQIERFAPGFRDTIIGRHTYNTREMEAYNANYIGGDINGGELNITQLFTRPALRRSPYKTSAKGIYICSASTPPGGGVHGMCGYNAARQVLRDLRII